MSKKRLKKDIQRAQSAQDIGKLFRLYDEAVTAYPTDSGLLSQAFKFLMPKTEKSAFSSW